MKALGYPIAALALMALGYSMGREHSATAGPIVDGPAWIGHNCQDAGGDLWAASLSDFPTQCKDFERWQ